MTRRSLLCSTLLFPTLRVSSSAAPNFPGTRFGQYANCLPEYLATLAQQATLRRTAALNALTSPVRIQARQKYVRDVLWRLIGGPEERTPLKPQTVGKLQREGYRVEKVIYESRPNLFISANLYVPDKGRSPFPAVLFQSGHYWEGKGYPSYQRCCQGLAQLGFVVLAFDPMGQGERINYLDAAGTASRLSSCDAEHTVPGEQLILFGDSSTRFQLWDAIRSLDYLVSLPYVDGKRVASVGHSGGGTLTMLLAAVDDRLSAAAVCMGNIENVIASPFRPPGATDDAEQDLVYGGPAGVDRWDLLYPLAPKPLLIWPSDRDFFATYSPDYVRNGWQEYGRLRKVYETLGHPERIAWADTPLPHALAYDSRLLVYNWFCRWLQESKTRIEQEPAVKPESAADLRVTKSGSVVRNLNGATPHSLIAGRKVERIPAALDELLRADRPARATSAEMIGRVKSRTIDVQVLEVASHPSVRLPAFLLIPEKTPAGRPILLVLDEMTHDRLWFTPEVDLVLSETSPIICSAEVRGVGSLIPAFSPGAADYEAWHQQEENYAWGSLMLGKPLVGQRVTDILALVAALRSYSATKGRAIYVAALGKLTVPALFAAAIDPAISGLYLAGGLVSFQNVIETEVYKHPLANFVPGLLKHTDLPAIAATVAPRKVLLAGAVDASGQLVDHPALRASYSEADKAGNLATLDFGWSAESLLSLLENKSLFFS